MSTPAQRGVKAVFFTLLVIALFCGVLFGVHWHEIATNDGAHWTVHMMQFVFGVAAAAAALLAAIAWAGLEFLRRRRTRGSPVHDADNAA